MKFFNFLPIPVFLIALVSCTKATSISGKVVNQHTGEGIPDAYVYLLLGQQSTNGLLGSEGDDEGYVSTITDGNGNFSIEGKSDILEILGVKEGYTWIKTTDAGLTGNQISPGDYNNYFLQFIGDASFNSPFIKTNYVLDESENILEITLLSYNDLNDDLRSLGQSSRGGIGPHYFISENSEIHIEGDRYLRYKLKFTTPDGWETVIDSVFIPTSSEIYDEPIYY